MPGDSLGEPADGSSGSAGRSEDDRAAGQGRESGSYREGKELPFEIAGAQAVEATIEGLPAAVSLSPSTVMPSLGGELVLPDGAVGEIDRGGDVARESVVAGLTQAGPLAIAGVLANGLNVVVTVVLARLLETRGYGVLNQLTSLFLIVSMPGSAVIVAVVRKVTRWTATTGSTARVREWGRRIHKRSTAGLVVFVVAVVAAGHSIAHLIGRSDSAGVVAILVAGGIWVVLSIDRGLLQAHRGYKPLALNLVVEGVARSAFMVIFVTAGFGATGAAIGVLLGEAVTAAHARFGADRVWSDSLGAARRDNDGVGRAPRTTDPSQPVEIGRRLGAMPEKRLERKRTRRWVPSVAATDLGAALTCLAILALLQNIDVLIVGRENAGMSGSYAAVSVASKALVFGAIVLGGYLLPEAAIRWRDGGHALSQLAVVMIILAVPAGVLLALAFGAPGLVLSLVFSPRYTGAKDAFGVLVLAMVCLSITVVLTMYLLAVGRRWIMAVLLAGTLLAYVTLASAHGKPVATAREDLLAQGAIALVVALGFIKLHHRRVQTRQYEPQ